MDSLKEAYGEAVKEVEDRMDGLDEDEGSYTEVLGKMVVMRNMLKVAYEEA